MYASRTTQFIVGIFVALGIAAIIYLSVRLGNVGLFPAPSYTLFASFDNIGGLRTGDQVEIAGVRIGKVEGISLEDNRARVGLTINRGVEVDSDAIAAIKTTGLIGDKYVSIQLGAGDTLANDGTIRQTQSTFAIEDIVGQLINSYGSKGPSGSAAGQEGGADSTGATGSTGEAAGASAPGMPGMQSSPAGGAPGSGK
ncbi:MAG: outer membrane lipid asymmetry maintenance protein MlaD [Candidatus Binataceae bacterium]